jgi:hypothetical protein
MVRDQHHMTVMRFVHEHPGEFTPDGIATELRTEGWRRGTLEVVWDLIADCALGLNAERRVIVQ